MAAKLPEKRPRSRARATPGAMLASPCRMAFPAHRPRPFFETAAFFYLLLATAGTLWLGWQRGRLGLGLFVAPGGWGIDLGAGIVLGGSLLAGWRLWRRLSATARRIEAELAALLAPLSRGEAVALAVISALAEEVFFRGALQGAIGWLPTALLFALLHLGPGRNLRLWSLFALAAGLVLGAWVHWRGALGGAILAHLLVNGVNLLALARRSRTAAPGSERGEGGDPV